ncbi:MAG: histidine triad nucleotide-binding protein [Fibrobacterota bacterium]|jgi:histidine triad (HIT) family protein
MSECLFCKIVSREIPADIVYEDSHCIAFRDIDPQAPVHILVVPHRHIESVHTIPAEQSHLMSSLFDAVRKIVVDEEISESGYRLVINSGKDGQQSVPHLHIHILGKRSLQWPPG